MERPRNKSYGLVLALRVAAVLGFAIATAASCGGQRDGKVGEECSDEDDCAGGVCACGVCDNGNSECGPGGSLECSEGFSCAEGPLGHFCRKSCASSEDCPGSMTCDTVLFECVCSG